MSTPLPPLAAEIAWRLAVVSDLLDRLRAELAAVTAERDAFKAEYQDVAGMTDLRIERDAVVVERDEARAEIAELRHPVPMILFCPACGAQHVDAPESGGVWNNPPHKTHLCHACGHCWRPAGVATNGVADISLGEHDEKPPVRRGVEVVARLRVPAGADAMERAKRIRLQGAMLPGDYEKTWAQIARAIEAAAREARERAIEEAAQVARREYEKPANTADMIEAAVRSLAAHAPPADDG